MKYMNIPRALLAYKLALIAFAFYAISYGLSWLADKLIPESYTLQVNIPDENISGSSEISNDEAHNQSGGSER